MSKIFQLISSIQLGGAEMVAFDLAENCNNNHTLFELYSTSTEYALAKKEELYSKNIRFKTLHNGPKRMSLIFAPFKLFYYIWKEKPSIIHSHSDLPDLVLGLVIRFSRLSKLKMPNIIRTIHNTQLWRNHYWMGKITESVYKDDRIVSVSYYSMLAYEKLRKKYGLKVSKYKQIINNGRKTPQKLAYPFPLDKEKINIAFCGRFEDYKGMDTLIPVVIEVERRYPGKFTFHVIGSGTYRKQLEQLSREQSHMFLYEPIPNVSTMFHEFDYLFFPSHFEGLALTSIEASFSGVPVIASFAPGLEETLPEKWPLKFHLNNDKELYDIFDKINSNSLDKEAIKKMAYDYVNERFSLEKMINSYNKLYNKML
ncbi:MAG: glycosyltransferase family 4 protein [Fermentimonas sp.]|nr:glycosyltransferase family 4 protein [Fermentimonas sp.]